MWMRRSIAAALVIAAVVTSGCGGGAEEEQAAPPAPGIPGASGGTLVYSLSRDSYFTKPLAGGDPKLAAVADGELDRSLFQAWTGDAIVYEVFKDGRRDLWRAEPGRKDQRQLEVGIGGVIGLRGNAVVYIGDAAEGDDDALIEQDLASGAKRELLTGASLSPASDATSGPLPFIDRDGSEWTLWSLEPSSDEPVRIATVDGGKSFGAVRATRAGLAYAVNAPMSEYGEVFAWDRASGRAVKAAEDGRLLAASPDGGLLLMQNLRGGVSGVPRSKIAYVPTGGASFRQQDLGTYVGTLHAVAFAGGGRVLMSSRTEGVNRLELFDLATYESHTLQEDGKLQVDEMLPMEDGALCVRVRPGVSTGSGAADGGDTQSAPEVVSLEEELLWVPFDGASPIVLESTASGPMDLVQAAR